MKCLIRSCLLLVCCCFLFFAFSPIVANASAMSNYEVYMQVGATKNGNLAVGMQYPFDSARQTLTVNKSIVVPSLFSISAEWYISNANKSALFDAGQSIEVKVENLYFKGSYSVPNIATYTLSDPIGNMYFFYTDGTNVSVGGSVEKTGTDVYTVRADYTPKKDVQKVLVTLSFPCANNLFEGDKEISVNVTTGEPTVTVEPNNNIIYTNMSSDEVSEEVGWLAKIWDTLTGGFDDLVAGIGDLFNSIAELPRQIWDYISEGLQSLFVPDDEFLASYKDKWETLLSDKLGAVWQVIDVTLGAWDDIQFSDEDNSIFMPVVTIPLPGNNSFSFGGYDVQVVPDGFDIVVSGLKSIVGIIATLAFVNGLRKRYDNIMEG